MPELPEVETVVRTLAPYLIGRRTAGRLSRHLIFHRDVIDPPDPEDGQ